MKRFLIKLSLIVIGLTIWTVAEAQVSYFKSYKETKGAVTEGSRDTYVWGPWVQSSCMFILNISKHTIVVDDQLNKSKIHYEIFDKPQKWIIKKNYKYINFECMETESLEKYYIRLCEYDTGVFKITVMSPKNAIRYQVLYLKDKDKIEEDIKFDDV